MAQASRLSLPGRYAVSAGKEPVMLRADEVPEGEYFLCAAPLKLAGSDGSPCRALLIDFEGERP